MNRKLITTALAVFCASLATALLARSTNAVTITREEYEALVQYHTERLDTTNAIALTAGEWEVLDKCRADEVAEKAKEAAEDARRKALTKWQRVKEDWGPGVGGLAIWVALFVGAPMLFAGLGILKEKWDNWRTDVWYRKNNP